MAFSVFSSPFTPAALPPLLDAQDLTESDTFLPEYSGPGSCSCLNGWIVSPIATPPSWQRCRRCPAGNASFFTPGNDDQDDDQDDGDDSDYNEHIAIVTSLLDHIDIGINAVRDSNNSNRCNVPVCRCNTSDIANDSNADNNNSLSDVVERNGTLERSSSDISNISNIAESSSDISGIITDSSSNNDNSPTTISTPDNHENGSNTPSTDTTSDENDNTTSYDDFIANLISLDPNPPAITVEPTRVGAGDLVPLPGVILGLPPRYKGTPALRQNTPILIDQVNTILEAWELGTADEVLFCGRLPASRPDFQNAEMALPTITITLSEMEHRHPDQLQAAVVEIIYFFRLVLGYGGINVEILDPGVWQGVKIEWQRRKGKGKGKEEGYGIY